MKDPRPTPLASSQVTYLVAGRHARHKVAINCIREQHEGLQNPQKRKASSPHTCRSERMSTKSAASIATSVPAPMASPTSAAASAGESLTPSPTCERVGKGEGGNYSCMRVLPFGVGGFTNHGDSAGRIILLIMFIRRRIISS